MDFKKIGVTLVILIISLIGNSLQAQITVSADKLKACAPDFVTFTRSNAGAGEYFWDFGVGTGFVQNDDASVQYNYTVAGNYTVRCELRVGGVAQETGEIAIEINSRPVVNISSADPLTGCLPLTIDFEGGVVAESNFTVDWAFGDTQGSDQQNVSKTYNQEGEYNVSLTAEDENGCIGTDNVLVMASDKPVPIISTNPVNAYSCEPPLRVDFSGNNSVSNWSQSNNLTFDWDFDNGQSSTSSVQTMTFTTDGNYNVRLTVTNDAGCSDSTFKVIAIGSPHAEFVTNDTVCSEVEFQDLSYGGESYWRYDDGLPFTENTRHIYTTPGEKTVTLRVINGDCEDDTTMTVNVVIIEPDFEFDKEVYCETEFDFQLTNNTTPDYGNTYIWDFGNGITSTEEEPGLTVNIRDTNSYYRYDPDATLDGRLIVTNRFGCEAEIRKSALIATPTAVYFPELSDDLEGCSPLSVAFSDSSLFSNANVITKWTYLVDGVENTVINGGGDGDATLTIAGEGEHEVVLVVETELGCVDTSYIYDVHVGAPIGDLDFSAAKTTLCVNEEIELTGSSAIADDVDRWFFTPGDSLSAACYGSENSNYFISSQAGTHDITLTAVYNGCETTVTKSDYITIQGPVVHIDNIIQECDTPLALQLEIDATETDSVTVNWGDASSLTSELFTHNHAYADTGTYELIIIGKNNSNGCPDYNDTLSVDIRRNIPDFEVDGSFCTNVPVDFDAVLSEGYATGAHEAFTWFWGDDTPPIQTDRIVTSHIFRDTGHFDITLITQDANLCKDTITKTFKFYEVEPVVWADTVHGCRGLEVQFADSSTSDTAIVDWTWELLDTTITGVDNLKWTFTDPEIGSYRMFLTIVNAEGCESRSYRDVTINLPDADFHGFDTDTTAQWLDIDTTHCSGEEFYLHAMNRYSSYFWIVDGDTLQDSIQSPLHTLSPEGVYGVRLEVIDELGCRDTLEKDSLIRIQDLPDARIFSESLVECYDDGTGQGNTLAFQDSSSLSPSTVDNLTMRQWNFEGSWGPESNSKSASWNFKSPGQEDIYLRVTSDFGCVDVDTFTLTLIGPQGDFDMYQDGVLTEDPVLCKYDTLEFRLDPNDTSDVASFKWFYGDGASDSNLVNTFHQYRINPVGGNVEVSMLLFGSQANDKGQVCRAAILDTIYINEVIADFRRNGETSKADTANCTPFNVLFSNTSVGASGYNWDFGNGQSSTALNPGNFVYEQPGTYSISLAIEDNVGGCVDTITKEIIVFDLPGASLGDDTFICYGDSTQLNAVVGDIDQYSWTPTDFLSNPNSLDPYAFPEQTTIYVLSVRDSNNCRRSDSIEVYVQQVPQEYISGDTTIIIGDTAYVRGSAGGSELSYTWTPDYHISCLDCSDPILRPLEDTDYEVLVEDSLGCFSEVFGYTVFVEESYKASVPTAFTPNGDSRNERVFIRGHGIRELVDFKIFNRFGEVVYESSKLSEGWDGTYKGKPQPIETYAYYFKVIYWDGRESVVQKGFIELLR